MAFKEYEDPPNGGSIRQGEILSELWELRPAHPTVKVDPEISVSVVPLIHPRLVVITQDCDLISDYKARFEGNEQADPGSDRDHPSTLPHILFCELYEEKEIRTRVAGSDIFRRVKSNQDERYHKLFAAPIGHDRQVDLPDLYLDLKKILTLPTKNVYDGINLSRVKRLAVVPPIHLHDLLHRFFAFQSRVAVPED